MAKNLSDSIYPRGKKKTLWARFYFTHIKEDGEKEIIRYHFSLNTSDKDVALPRLFEAYEFIKRGEYDKNTKDFEHAVKLYLETSPSERNKGIIKKHLSKFFKGKRISQITKEPTNDPFSISVVKYKLWRERPKQVGDKVIEGAKASTLSKELRCLKEVIQCVDPDWQNPSWRDTKDMILQNQNETIKRPLEFEEVYKVCDEVVKFSAKYGREYLKIGIVAAHSSMRLKDIVFLREKNVDRKNHKISFYQSKVENLRKSMGIQRQPKLVSFKMAEAIIEIIGAIPHNLDQEATFFSVPSTNAVSKAYERAFENIGLKGYSFNQFRHFWGSYAAAGGADLNTIKEIMGHARLSTTEKYLSSYDKKKEDAIDIFNKGPKEDQIKNAKKI